MADLDVAAWGHPIDEGNVIGDYAVQHSGWGATLKKGRQTYNIQLALNKDSGTLTASANVEIQLTDDDDYTPAREMASNWLIIQRDCAQLLRSTFKIDIESTDHDNEHRFA